MKTTFTLLATCLLVATSFAQGLSIRINSYNTSDTACMGDINIEVFDGTAPYGYIWSHDSLLTDSATNNLCEGVYGVTVYDSAGDTATAFYNIMAYGPAGPNNIVLYYNLIDNVTCYSQGWIPGSVDGGTPPYSYNWSSGDTTESLSNIDNPGVYGLTVTDDNGLTSSQSFTVTSSGVTPAVLNGLVVSEDDTTVAITSGTAYVLSVNNSWNNPDTLDIIPINANGTFSFSHPSGNDLVVLFQPDLSAYPEGVNTYFFEYADVPWGEDPDYRFIYDSAHVAGTNKCETLDIKIRLIETDVLTGDNTISGSLLNVDTLRAGDPIPGIGVSLEQIPGGIIDQVVTDSQGLFEFTNVPNGNYKINVDMPGESLISTYAVDLTNSSGESVQDQDFVVTDQGIEATNPNFTSIKRKEGNTTTAVFPNPTNDLINVIGLTEGRYTYVVSNSFGQVVKTGNHVVLNSNSTLLISNLNAGYYNLSIKSEQNTIQTFKVAVIK